MRRVVLLRHGPTSWNEAGRIQGHTDIPLSDAGRAAVLAWRLPAGLAMARCVCSPLGRAVETAALLGFRSPALDARLMEMSWGDFEGETLSALRDRFGSGFAALEERGLDFQPPGGETPRRVASRLHSLLVDLPADIDAHLLVTHKGVLRAGLVLATGWPMLGPPPLDPARDQALSFDLDARGALHGPALVDLRSD